MQQLFKKILRSLQNIIFIIKPFLTERQFLYLSCILVSISSAIAAIVLKGFAHIVLNFSTYITQIAQIPYIKSILPIIGILTTIYLVKRFLSGKIEKGTAQLMIAVGKRSGIMPKEQMYAQILTSSLTVGMGGSAGLESPITITGAAFGSNYAQYYDFKYKHRTLLLACGVAAGIATAFNAPIAGVLFAIEVVLADMSVTAFIPLLMASATGAIFGNLAFKDNFILSLSHQLSFDYRNTLYYVALGLIAGFLSIYYARTFRRVEGAITHHPQNAYIKGFIGASLLGLLIFIFPSLFGEGYEGIKSLANNSPASLVEHSFLEMWTDNSWAIWLIVVALMFIKTIATGLTLGSGGNGGNFAPSLFVGSYLGFAFSKFVELTGIKPLPIENFTVVGMAAVLSGLFHAPLTAIFLIAEMTGGYGLIIPLMIVSSISFAIAKKYDKYPMDLYKIANKGLVFTSDKDRNLIEKIILSHHLKNDVPTISLPFTFRDIKEGFTNNTNAFLPVIDEKKQTLGIIYLTDIQQYLPYEHLPTDTLYKLVKPIRTFSIRTRTQNVLRYMDASHSELVLIADNNIYIGYIKKIDLMESYRTNVKELRVE